MGIPRDRRRGFNKGTQGLVRELQAMGAPGERVRMLLAFIRLWPRLSTHRCTRRCRARAGWKSRPRDPRLDHIASSCNGRRPRGEALYVPTRADSRQAFREIQEPKARGCAGSSVLAAGPREEMIQTREHDHECGRPLPLRITPDAALRELADLQRKLAEGSKRLGAFTEEDLAIATTPVDEVLSRRHDAAYKMPPDRGQAERHRGLNRLCARRALPDIDRRSNRSFVRQAARRGHRRLLLDWGNPTPAQRWLTIDDYVSGYLEPLRRRGLRARRHTRRSIDGGSARAVFSRPACGPCFPEKWRA